MQNAYECEEEFDRSGRVLKRRRVVGPAVPFALVGFFALLWGRDLPTTFWSFVKIVGR